MRHTYTCSVRWGDMDAFGHVNNVVWADYLQEARADMLRLHARGPATGALLEGTIVVGQRLQYLASLVFDGLPVSVEVWVAELKAATFTLAYEIFREAPDGSGARTVYLRAHTVLAPYVFAEQRPRRLTQAERDQLAAYLPAPGAEAPIEPVVWSQPRHTEEGHAPITVRFSDVDVYGHANNVIYLEYFQESRILLMARQQERAGLDGAMPGIVVAQQEVGYKRPMVMRAEPYDTWTWVSRMGRTSMVVEAEITDPLADGAVAARGRFVLVFIDRVTGAPTPPPEALAEVIGASLS